MAPIWKQIRKDFPIAGKRVFLDHAAGGPMPRPVFEKVRSHYRSLAGNSDFDWMKWVRHREDVRKKMADFINAEPDEIAFTQCTSHGMNLVAELLAGEGVVLTNTCEFPSSTIPWIARKAVMRWQEPDGAVLSLSGLRLRLDKKVKTIVTSYVQYASGFRQDLTALGKLKSGRYLVINATQGLGAFPVDVQKWNADFLVSNSYKWLMAGYGGGILYIRKHLLKKFRPQTVGWRSMDLPERMDNRRIRLAPKAMRYELGCPPFPVIYAMGAAVDYLNGIGMENIESRVLELTDYLIDGLEHKGYEVISPGLPEQRSGIVVFRASGAEPLWKRLLGKNIYVSVRGGGIRVAPHFYNSFAEIDALLKNL